MKNLLNSRNIVTTRCEMWKKYRNEIEENIALQQSVRNSNDKLQILYQRLIKVFPDYEKKYVSQLQSFKINLEKIVEVPFYPLQKIQEILDKIHSIENDQVKNAIKFDDLNFSTKVLDSIITTIREGTNKQKLQEKSHKKNMQVVIKNPKTINLEKPLSLKFSVAIDGPSGVGKSTIARLLAKKWQLFYLNTGLVYRAVALKILLLDIDYEKESEIIKILKPHMIKLNIDETVELDNKDVTLELRSDNISQLASKISTYPSVREYALKIQMEYAKNNGIIAEGRDTTFRVLPHADIKIYLDTSQEVRAQRRVNQNAQLGFNTNYDEILQAIIERDHRDLNRELDPLHKTADAVYIDASYLSIDDVVEKINQIIIAKLKIH